MTDSPTAAVAPASSTGTPAAATTSPAGVDVDSGRAHPDPAAADHADAGAPPTGHTGPTGPTVHQVRPTPTDDELAAIMAAFEVAWPRPSAPVVDDEPSRWRFSGRWWSRPVPTRRGRP